MAVTVVVEDETGVTGANAYESVAAVETRLSDLGYTVLSSLASDDDKAAFVVRATRSLDRSLRNGARGRPRRDTQGLFYPRAYYYTMDRFVDVYTIPEEVKLASALKAEFLARREAATNQLASIPAGVTEVQFADGVRVKKTAGALRDVSLDDLHIEVVGLLDSLTAYPVAPPSLAWGA